jgi:hypothetical protein
VLAAVRGVANRKKKENVTALSCIALVLLSLRRRASSPPRRLLPSSSFSSLFVRSVLPVVHPPCPVLSWRRSSSAPPLPPTSSGSQAGWWCCVTWHLSWSGNSTHCHPASSGSQRRRRAGGIVVVIKPMKEIKDKEHTRAQTTLVVVWALCVRSFVRFRARWCGRHWWGRAQAAGVVVLCDVAPGTQSHPASRGSQWRCRVGGSSQGQRGNGCCYQTWKKKDVG